MKQSRIWIGLAAMMALSLTTAGHAHAQPTAQVTYEITLEGVGSGKAITVPLESWSWGASERDASEDAKDAKDAKKTTTGVEAQQVYIVIESSKISAQIVDAMFTKQALSRVSIRNKGAPAEKALELVLSDARIASFQTGGSSGSGYAMDQIAIAYKAGKLTIGTKKAAETAGITGSD